MGQPTSLPAVEWRRGDTGEVVALVLQLRQRVAQCRNSVGAITATVVHEDDVARLCPSKRYRCSAGLLVPVIGRVTTRSGHAVGLSEFACPVCRARHKADGSTPSAGRLPGCLVQLPVNLRRCHPTEVSVIPILWSRRSGRRRHAAKSASRVRIILPMMKNVALTSLSPGDVENVLRVRPRSIVKGGRRSCRPTAVTS